MAVYEINIELDRQFEPSGLVVEASPWRRDVESKTFGRSRSVTMYLHMAQKGTASDINSLEPVADLISVNGSYTVCSMHAPREDRMMSFTWSKTFQVTLREEVISLSPIINTRTHNHSLDVKPPRKPSTLVNVFAMSRTLYKPPCRVRQTHPKLPSW